MQRLRSREVSSRLTLSFARLTLSFARHQASVQTPKFQRGFALENWEVQRGGAVHGQVQRNLQRLYEHQPGGAKASLKLFNMRTPPAGTASTM